MATVGGTSVVKQKRPAEWRNDVIDKRKGLIKKLRKAPQVDPSVRGRIDATVAVLMMQQENDRRELGIEEASSDSEAEPEPSEGADTLSHPVASRPDAVAQAIPVTPELGVRMHQAFLACVCMLIKPEMTVEEMLLDARKYSRFDGLADLCRHMERSPPAPGGLMATLGASDPQRPRPVLVRKLTLATEFSSLLADGQTTHLAIKGGTAAVVLWRRRGVHLVLHLHHIDGAFKLLAHMTRHPVAALDAALCALGAPPTEAVTVVSARTPEK